MIDKLKVSTQRKCNFKKKDNNGELLSCGLRSLEDDTYCIFHSENISKKTNQFDSAFNLLIEQIENNNKMMEYNFRGFVFPKISLKYKVFNKMVDIRWATFTDMADFENAFFKNGMFAHKTNFKGIAFFQGAKFHNSVSFVGTEFNKLIFIGDKVLNKIVFHGCKFHENAVFQDRCFLDDVVFQSSIFYKNADFPKTEFHKKLDFSNSEFRGQLLFLNAKLLDEVVFNKTVIASLKNIKGSGINLDGTILHSTNFKDIINFHNYSFKNSVLIFCDFSNKSLINCDFTGAVLKSIYSDNISIDSKTCAKTKFIYTDYEEFQEAGMTRIIPKINSRIPLTGDFGDKDNINFTLIDYFQQFHKWNFLLDLPIEVRTGILNYINFFKDYIRSTEDINVDIATEPQGEKSKLSLLTKDETKKDIIAVTFQNYIENIFKPFDQINYEFRNNKLSAIQKESFITNYRDEHIIVRKRILYGLIDEQRRDKTALEISKMQIAEYKRDLEWFRNLIILKENKPPASINIYNQQSSNQEMNVEMENNIKVGIELASLSDELDNIKSKAHQAEIDHLKEEIKNILIEQKEKGDNEQLRLRTKTVLGALGKAANYGIQNFDKIVNIGNAIAKLLGFNFPSAQ